jgi:hypothetical protein
VIAAHAAPPGGDVFGATYEALRHRVLTGAAFGGAGGLVVLLRDGLAAWMARGSAGAAAVKAAVKAAGPARRGAAPLVSDEIHAAVVRVLANIALAGLKEMRA